VGRTHVGPRVRGVVIEAGKFVGDVSPLRIYLFQGVGALLDHVYEQTSY
jgi:hypothetical protein